MTPATPLSSPADFPTVLFVSVTGGLGGPTRSLVSVLSRLEGSVRRVLAAPRTGDFVELAHARGIVEGHVVLARSRTWRRRHLARVLAAGQLAVWILRHRRELLAIHANGIAEMNLAAPGAILARVPVVVWVHAYRAPPWGTRLAPAWRRFLRSARWAAVSGTARQVAVDAGLVAAERVHIIPNPIDPADVLGPAKGRGDDVVVGYLGSTLSDKGFALLPEIIERVRDDSVRWLVFTSRPGEYSAEAERVLARLGAAADGRVSVEGRIQDVRDAYERCDIVVVPSRRESFCRIAAEAMMNGIPVVASDLEPLRALLGRDEAGLLFAPGDAAQAAEAVTKLAREPELRARLGERGRARAGDFVPEAVVPRLAALYRA